MEGLLWRFNRLRCMSPAEIAHRVLRAARMQAERLGAIGSHAVPAADLGIVAPRWIDEAPAIDAERYVAAAERIAAGRFDVFALRDIELGSPPAWNRDPKTGTEAPLAFGKLLDYRKSSLVGDIKYLWEPNRHLHLVTLAQAFALTGERRHYEVLREHLESWLDACPYRMGANWSSALEVGIRLVNWSIAWQLLGGAQSELFRDDEGARFRGRWLEAVYQHAEFIASHYSLHSSANNHLLGEAAGAFIASVTWPHWPQAKQWGATAAGILEREGLLQNGTDGVNLEQAISYQQFTFDFLLFPLLAGRAAGHEFSAALRERLEKMLEYIASVMDVGRNVPMIGDADDGYVTKLSQDPAFCPFRSLLATGAVLFGRGEFKDKAGELDDKTRWLLGRGVEEAYAQLPAGAGRLPVRRAFPEGGYYILGCGLETPAEIRLVADAGALGYQSIAAHGHADALSFTLSVGGREFLIDPGTYAYHTQRAWRQYFRGTAAHNTVRIDETDQSQPGGNFMWLKKARASCISWVSSAARDVFIGAHDGYSRLADPVAHRRSITLEKAARRIVIEDTLDMAGAHDVELNFHCSEHCRVELTECGCILSRDGISVTLELPKAEGARTDVLVGSEAPIRGWVSRSFDRKEPAPTIVWRARLAGDVTLLSYIDCPLG
jgi:hypothetical protein